MILERCGQTELFRAQKYLFQVPYFRDRKKHAMYFVPLVIDVSRDLSPGGSWSGGLIARSSQDPDQEVCRMHGSSHENRGQAYYTVRTGSPNYWEIKAEKEAFMKIMGPQFSAVSDFSKWLDAAFTVLHKRFSPEILQHVVTHAQQVGRATEKQALRVRVTGLLDQIGMTSGIFYDPS